MKILVLIPCYNHGKYLPHVISDVKKYCNDIVVINDGSTDNTGKILSTLSGVKIFHHPINKGKGAALKTGFEYAIKNGYHAVITIDADGQHKAFDIPNFIKNSDDCHMLIGSRMYNVRHMPLRRVLANFISSFFVSLKSGMNVPDSQSGYRLIKTSALRNLDLQDDGYQMETEIILKAAKLGYKIGHIPIDTIYGTEVSHVSPIKTGIRFLKTLIKN
ncbi:MAG: glycosyltransferase family 2 protein [Nanoarchaeota archaeon]